jgi:hypothetical protein
MSRRTRILAFGSAAALVVVGAILGVAIGGHTGEIVGVTLGTLGLGAVILLVFLEIGLSEDRELAKEERLRREAAERTEADARPPHRRRHPRRPL